MLGKCINMPSPSVSLKFLYLITYLMSNLTILNLKNICNLGMNNSRWRSTNDYQLNLWVCF